MVIFCKKRRYKEFSNYIASFVSKEIVDDYVFVDSTREITFYLFFIPFIKFFYRKKIAIILTSVCSSKKSSISIRKPASSLDIFVSKLIFPINLEKNEMNLFAFYSWPILFLLKLVGNINFNPWHEGVSDHVDVIYSRYPLSFDHENELIKKKVNFIYKGEFYNDSIKYFHKKKEILFSLPQFYEQGLLSLSDSKKIISKMISHIFQKEGIYPDIILHPRMKGDDYFEFGKDFYQFNLTEVLPEYKKYYCINSSTIFIALKFGCSCRVFVLSFLDYSAFENLNSFDLKFITLDD